MAKERITLNACQGWGCHEHCIIETHTVDGKIVRTATKHLPGPKPDNAICAKGILSGRIPYAKDRVLYPLKRTGERGEGKFERITWDQAFDEIGAKLVELIDKYGSESIMINDFWCGYPGDYRSLQNSLIYRFCHSFGGSILECTDVDDAVTFAHAVDYGEIGSTSNRVLAESNNYILTWGGNPLGFTRPGVTTRMYMDAQERGAKLVHVSNLFDITSAKSDQWVVIKSGTDAALALAMANVIIEENKVDFEYLNEKTVAAFLVRDDTGAFLREADIDPEGSPANFVYLDAKTSKPAIITRASEFPTEPDLNAITTVAGIDCQTAYVLLKKSVARWTPKSQEELTGVPAEVCRQLANEYVDSKPSTIYAYYGLRYRNALPAVRALHLLAILSGNLGLKGGRFVFAGSQDTSTAYTSLNDLPIFFPDGKSDGGHVALTEIIDSFDNPDSQQYKAWLNPMGNPLLNWPNKSLWKDTLLPNLELFVSWEIRMSDTALWADYVLPETTIFERRDILIGPDECIALNEKAIEPLGESKDATDIWRGISERMGLGQYWQESTDDWLRIRIQQPEEDIIKDSSLADGTRSATGKGVLANIDFDKLAAAPEAYHLNVPDQFHDSYEDLNIATVTGRLEFYSEMLAPVGGAIAEFEEAIIHDKEVQKKYPLQFFPGRHRYFMQGQFTNIPELRLLADSQFGCALNPVTAQERGLKDGDVVEVFNDRGVMKVPLHVRRFLPPGMAHVWYSFPWSTYVDGEPPQALATPENTRESETPISRVVGPAIWGAAIAAGVPRTLIPKSGFTTNEVFWDTLCDVRKAKEA